MPTLTVVRVSSSRVEIQLADDAGTPTGCYTVDPTVSRAQSRVAADTGLPVADVVALLLRVRDTPRARGTPQPRESVPYTLEPPVAEFRLVLRGLRQPVTEGRVFTGPDPVAVLREALEVTDYPEAEPVLQWDGTDRLCCLDVDYHYPDGVTRPDPTDTENLAMSVRPVPVAVHMSHGRGAKLYYVASAGLAADELAAAGAVAWLNRDGRATVELKRESRHPRYPRPDAPAPLIGDPIYLSPTTDLGPLRAWLLCEPTPDAISDYLEVQGWEIGRRYPHTACPIAPRAGGDRDPVVIRPGGVFCYACEGRDRSLGYRFPGWASWGQLVGHTPSQLVPLARRCAHWTHARIVLADTLPQCPEGVLRPAYSAVLKTLHGADDPRVPAAFAAGAEMVRVRGRWTTPDGAVTYGRDIVPLLRTLPATWVDGSPAASTVNLFQQPVCLEPYGYPDLSPVRGIRVWGEYLPYGDGRIAYAAPDPEFTREPWMRPRYRPTVSAEQLEAAWRHVERTFPGINRRYVELLVVLKGFAEGGATQAPFVLVTGPSGSAKSGTVHVAASICGDRAGEPVWTPQSERLRQSIGDSLDAGTFVVLNEIFKGSTDRKVSPIETLNFLLTLTPESRSHKLYVGSVPYGRLPALVLTDIEVPPAVAADEQIGRRLIYVPLDSRVDWDRPVSDAGFGSIGRYRASSPEAAAACDVILSHVIYTHFRTPGVTLESVAATLGYGTLKASASYGDPYDELRTFFKLVCDAPPTSGSDAGRADPAKGWRAIRRDDTGPLADVWQQLATGPAGDDWTRSRRCKEVDWCRVLGIVGDPVHFDVFAFRQSVVYVRFRRGTVLRPTGFNSEITS